MKEFVARLFIKRKSRSSLFTDALVEGMRDTAREMGYKTDSNSKETEMANDHHEFTETKEQLQLSKNE